jgi:hypothetical protein
VRARERLIEKNENVRTINIVGHMHPNPTFTSLTQTFPTHPEKVKNENIKKENDRANRFNIDTVKKKKGLHPI